ncbi:MAG: hypothetical protein Tsb0020_01480 [Haliangiales bacterium]
MNRGASLYFRRDSWIVGPLSPTETGPFVATEPYVKMPAHVSFQELATQVRIALSDSRLIPDIDFNDPARKQTLSPILRAAGVKSWSTFYRGAKLMTIRADDEQITLIPKMNKGARNGFSPVSGRQTLPANSTPEQLGAALERVFSLCQ